MPKLKILKSFVSAIGSFAEGETKELELDAYTLENWVENGLVSEVKTPKKKVVTEDEN